ncbi:MAG: hypothetical protein WBQ73_02645 [Candidatus Babeliales bacterium]
MAMDLNGTVVCQLVHFYIACLILRRFLYKPVLEHLKEKQQEKALFLEEVKNQEEAIRLLKMQKQKKWVLEQKKLLASIPQNPLVSFQLSEVDLEKQSQAQTKVHTTIDWGEVRKKLTEGIAHVRSGL